MVASQTTMQRFAAPPVPMLDGRWRIWRFTRADAEALMRQGLIPEDATTELLSGMIVLKDRSARGEDPQMIGKEHTITVERLSNLRGRINDVRRHVESQQPLACSDIHQPEPDFMVLRGKLEDYADLPTGADTFCVIEVADSSYERDAGEKLRGYAAAGVGQYVIINLRNRTAEVYTNPDRASGTYPLPRIVTSGERLGLCVGETEHFGVTLSEILP